MKKAISILALCLLAGCANKAEQAQSCADKFLEAFLGNDFDAATQLCSEDFKPEFGKTISNFKNLNGQVRQMLQEQCAQLSYEITAVQRVNKSDTFIVGYNIQRVEQDTAAFRQQELVVSTLRIVDGKVDALNK